MFLKSDKHFIYPTKMTKTICLQSQHPIDKNLELHLHVLGEFKHPSFTMKAYGHLHPSKNEQYFFVYGEVKEYHQEKTGVWENEEAIVEIFSRIISDQKILDLITAFEKHTGDETADGDFCQTERTVGFKIRKEFDLMNKKKLRSFKGPTLSITRTD